MAVEEQQERDSYTGYLTTGHEWGGIKELNTPVPRAVYFFLLIAFVFSVGYWVLMPAWPLGVSYTKELLGLGRRAWPKQSGTKSYQDIQAHPALRNIVRQTGRPLFGDNCAVCHGLNAKG